MTREEYQEAEANWDTWSDEDKLGFLRIVSEDHLSGYELDGTTHYDSFGAERTDDHSRSLYGYYDDESDTIYFNRVRLSGTNSFNEAIDTAIHEADHRVLDAVRDGRRLDGLEPQPTNTEEDHDRIWKDAHTREFDYFLRYDDLAYDTHQPPPDAVKNAVDGGALSNDAAERLKKNNEARDAGDTPDAGYSVKGNSPTPVKVPKGNEQPKGVKAPSREGPPEKGSKDGKAEASRTQRDPEGDDDGEGRAGNAGDDPEFDDFDDDDEVED